MMYNKSLEKIPRKIDDMYIYIYKKTERERFAVREYSLAPFLNLLSHKRLFSHFRTKALNSSLPESTVSSEI